MTLIEVVGGLGLLATLLVAILMAKARYTRQSAIAGRRLAAVAAADAMLTAWHQNPAALARWGGGVVPGDAALSWRTQIVANAAINEMDGEVVRLEILDDRSEASAAPVLTGVEFVIEPHPQNAIPGNAPTRPRRGGRGNDANKSGAALGNLK